MRWPICIGRPDAAGLGDFGSRAIFRAAGARWTRQYRGSQTDDLPEMEQLIAWLPETLPSRREPRSVALPHRQCRFGDGGRLTAVLEGAGDAGDPIADFSYFAAMGASADAARRLGGLDLDALGFRRWKRYDRYRARAGVGWATISRYFAYNLFRLAGISRAKEAPDRRHRKPCQRCGIAAKVPTLARARVELRRARISALCVPARAPGS